jgi:toxin YhaV
MSESNRRPWVIHGWTVFAHPLFISQFETLALQVSALQQKDPIGYVKKNASKRLAAITKLAFDAIPQDPTRPEYRQGNTLGDAHKHWFRAKFFQQYRLFFRYHAPSKVIVFAFLTQAQDGVQKTQDLIGSLKTIASGDQDRLAGEGISAAQSKAPL